MDGFSHRKGGNFAMKYFPLGSSQHLKFIRSSDSEHYINIFDALFILSLSILILNSRRVEGAKYVNVH